MKILIGYSVWNKVDMIAWLLSGIQEHCDPAKCDIAFHFDACTDDSVAAYDACMCYWLTIRGKWKMDQCHKLISPTEVRELGGHNRLLRLFMEGNYDMCLVAQDDQRFEAPIIAPLETLLDRYGDKLGIVGGRDAYGKGYNNWTGSRWSESPVTRRVCHGEFVELPYMNSGPVVYTRKVVEQVGYLDEEFRAYYAWDDYGQRAINAGFKNGVMGMDVTHAKFGRMKATEWCDWSSRDLARRQAKHGW